MFEEKIHRTAWILSLAGLLPFIWCAGETIAGSQIINPSPERVLFEYSAIILSFLGGITWAHALHVQGNASLSQWLLVIAVAPSLAGFFALLQQQVGACYIILLLSFSLWTGAEYSFLQSGLTQPWFYRLRVRISCAVISILLLSWMLR